MISKSSISDFGPNSVLIVPCPLITLYILMLRWFCVLILKMLGLYLYTRIISHKSYNMLSILNKLTLQKELQTVVRNNVFLDKK